MSGSEIPHLFFRWLHVLASVMWVGQLWSLAIVQRTASVEAADASAAGVALRAHGWMRWSGTAAWATGVLLLGIVYYGGGAATGPLATAALCTAARSELQHPASSVVETRIAKVAERFMRGQVVSAAVMVSRSLRSCQDTSVRSTVSCSRLRP